MAESRCLDSLMRYEGTHVITCAPALCVAPQPAPPVATPPPVPITGAPAEPPAPDGVPPKELGEPAWAAGLPPEPGLLPATPLALPPVLALPLPEAPVDAPP